VSQERLADQAGLHRTYIGHVERGEVNLTVYSLVRIATALGIDAAELLRGL
jgi:transcriptional regulator with XRE-family HTH domain